MNRDGVRKPIVWLEHYYPCIDLKLNREAIRKELEKVGLPYLVTTECDWCPHQDYARWAMHTPEVIDEAAKVEAAWGGKLFFTAQRIPLKEALAQMKIAKGGAPADFGCDSGGLCGI